MQQSDEAWRGRQVQVVVVSFESPSLLSALAEPFPADWHFVSDPTKTLYSLYGATAASLPNLLSPKTVWAYLRALFDGRLFRRRSRGDGQNADIAQLGGDFVIDREGRVVLAWRSTTPADRPEIETLQAALSTLIDPCSSPCGPPRRSSRRPSR